MHTVFQSSIWAGNPVFLFGIPALIPTFCIYFKFFSKKRFGDILKENSVLFCVLIILELWIILTQVDAYKNVVIAYQNGQYFSVVGEVSEYTPPASNYNPYETFQIDNVTFAYGGGAGKNYFGYDQTALDGGIITQNGLFVRILYVEYDFQNIIVQIDVYDQNE